MNELMTRKASVISTNVETCYDLLSSEDADKRVFQLVKHVTGIFNGVSTLDDYSFEKVDSWYGKESFLLSGVKGFIRVTLK